MKPRTLTFLGIGLAVAAAAAIGAWLNQQARTYYTDADTIQVAAAEAPVRSILWQPAQPVDSPEQADQYEPKISADGSLMVFVRGKAGQNADLYQRRRLADGWSEPEPIAAINTEHDELGPELSQDGKSLYFYSDRAGGLGGYDIWVSRVGPDGWSAPVNLGPSVNSEFSEYGPALMPDGLHLYFASNRPRPGEPRGQQAAWPATVREQRTRHDYDIYLADLGSTSAAEAVEILNTPFDEGAPAVSPAGDFLYFASDRPRGLGGFDIYRSRFLRGKLQQPENLGSAVNSAANDLDPAPSTDGFRLYFSSDRRTTGNEETPSREPARYSLWVSGSREVFTEAEPLRAGALFLQLWNKCWPYLLALLTALALAIAIYRLLRDESMRRRFARLSLMAKCLVVSLLIHIGILFLLAAWRVGGAIGDMLHSSGGSRVTLGSTGDGGLAAQVRGTFTSSDFHAAEVQNSRASIAEPEIAAAPVLMTAAPAALSMNPAPLQFTGRDAPAPTTAAVAPSPPQATTGLESRTPSAAPPAANAIEPSATLAAQAGPDVSPAALSPSPAAAPARVALAPASSPLPDVPANAPAIGNHSARIMASAPSAAATTLDPIGRATTAAPTRIPDAPSGLARSEPAAKSPEVGAAAPPTLPGSPAVSSTAVSLPPGAATPPEVKPGTIALPSVESTVPGSSPAAVGLASAMPEVGRGIETKIPGIQKPEVGASSATPEPAPQIGIASLPGEASRPGFQSATHDPTSIHIDAPASVLGTTPAMTPGAFLDVTNSLDHIASAPTTLKSDIPGASSIATRLPVLEAEPAKPAESFAQRAPEVRNEVLERTGGSKETERAVGLALEWFKRHQSPDGHWSGHDFDAACGQCSSPAEIDADSAMTGMALLCFLGAGHRHDADGPYRDVVKSALSWLAGREGQNGDLRRGETMYSQTIASVALCEAYAMTRDPWLEGPARRAVTFVAHGATARADSRSASDTSVLGWQIMAIKSAQRAGFSVPTTAFDAARRWLDQTGSGQPGRYGYKPGAQPLAAATAEAMFVQQLLGHSREEPRMRESASFILTSPPAWRREAPTYYWYYATLALFQQQGDAWREWNAAISRELLAHQHQEPGLSGSWDPHDEWSQLGGRVYQTAVCTLSLEVYYRYRLAESGPNP